MTKNGRLVTCDRCDKSIFLKYIGETEMDGGWTRIEHFEPLPNTWATQNKKLDRWNSSVQLCDNCSRELQSILDVFFAKTIKKEG